jgi:hypothetical protein
VPHRGCAAASVPINDAWQRTASYDKDNSARKQLHYGSALFVFALGSV